MKSKNTLVVNLFGGPGAGKSTMAADLFAKLKVSGVECELVTEFAKDLVWRESWKTFDDQLFVFANQHHRLKMVYGKVDVIVTDSPLICAIPYSRKEGGLFRQIVIERFDSFNNLNFFIERNVDHFSEIGRKHSLEESKMIDEEIKDLLEQNDVRYLTVDNGLGKPIKRMYDLTIERITK